MILGNNLDRNLLKRQRSLIEIQIKRRKTRKLWKKKKRSILIKLMNSHSNNLKIVLRLQCITIIIRTHKINNPLL